MKTVRCKCGRDRPSFVFDKKKRCDHCRIVAAQKKSKRHEAGWAEVRAQRNILLAQTDYMDNVSWRARKTKKELVVCDSYRNKLRDITESCEKPKDVIFPEVPK